MRLILTTMIRTMLVQPVWAQYIDADSLHSYCETWQQSGYSGNFEISHDGLKSATCASYMAAMADLGRQSCDFVDPEADFTALPLDEMLNLHVHWGTPEAGVNDLRFDDDSLGDPNSRVYEIREVLDMLQFDDTR